MIKRKLSQPKLTALELQIMEALWNNGASSVREILDTFPGPDKPAYTTVQTTVYRLERKGALRCVKRIANANIFEASISRDDARGRLIDDIVGLFGGGAKPVMARLIETGKLTMEDIKEAERTLKGLSGRKKEE